MIFEGTHSGTSHKGYTFALRLGPYGRGGGSQKGVRISHVGLPGKQPLTVKMAVRTWKTPRGGYDRDRPPRVTVAGLPSRLKPPLG